VTFRALGERAPQHPALARGEEIAVRLTGADGVTFADGLTWLDELRLALEIPGLGRYGLAAADVPAVVAAAARASSTKAHPIELTDDELTEILTRAL
jgi:alcohol dehydrogenase class IV